MQKWEYLRLWIHWSEKVRIEGKDIKNVWSFEYSGKHYLESDLDRVMNEIGQNGWELVGTLPFETTTSPGAWATTWTNGYNLFFKRPT